MVGLISDTHGLHSPEAQAALAGSDLILHAGDIGHETIISERPKLAPVLAVRGNTDRGTWVKQFPLSQIAGVENVFIYLHHGDYPLDPVAARFQVIVKGHSHELYLEERNGVLYINPGSAGPKRFKLPISLAKLVVNG